MCQKGTVFCQRCEHSILEKKSKFNLKIDPKITDVRAKHVPFTCAHVHCTYDNKIVRVINFPRFLGMYLP